MATDEQRKPMREKYWSELDEKGKTERLRQEIRHLKSQNKELIEDVRKLLVHSHSGTLLVMPITLSDGAPTYGGSIRFHGTGKDDVYI